MRRFSMLLGRHIFFAFFLLAGFLLLYAPHLSAGDFEGTLNSVSISDAAGVNQPPTANFTYINDGNFFTFDASTSSDYDGGEISYKWAFSDGTIKEGAIVTYDAQQNLADPLVVTLSVIDDRGSITILQETISFQTPFSLIIDNLDSGFSTTGLWGTTKYMPGYYGDNYRVASTQDGTATWSFSVPATQSYDIFMQWPGYGSKADTDVPYQILNNNTPVYSGTLDQSVNSGQFNLIGSFNLKTGDVSLIISRTSITSADAIKIVNSK